MRLIEAGPKTRLGAVPKTTRLTTAIVLLNGSLTNSCHAAPGVAVYGFMSTPSRGSTPSSQESLSPPRSGPALPAGATPSNPFDLCSSTMGPSAGTTENAALAVASVDEPEACPAH